VLRLGEVFIELHVLEIATGHVPTFPAQILHIFLTFKTVYCTSSEQQSFPPHFRYFFYLVLTASGELQYGWMVGAGGRQDGGFKNEIGKHMDALSQVIGLKPG